MLVLTFQSSYMSDGMQEFLHMMRGCDVIARSGMQSFGESAFRSFSAEGHVQAVAKINEGIATDIPDDELVDSGTASLRALAPLCKSVVELQFIGKLQRALRMARSSCVEGKLTFP